MVGALCLCAVDDVGDGQNAAGDWTGTYKNKGVIWRDDVAEEFHATQEHLLRSMCIHNKSHNLPLILGLNCVYVHSHVHSHRSRYAFLAERPEIRMLIFNGDVSTKRYPPLLYV